MTRSLRSKAHDLLRESLVDARRKANVTQAQLARRLGRHQSFVSKYENAERRLDVAEFVEVAIALKIDAATIVAKMQKMSAQPKRRSKASNR